MNIHSAELEMTVNMLIQIDKLVQLLESPVFTCMLLCRNLTFKS
jgi:vacuole morphology and inheritance protein 14